MKKQGSGKVYNSTPAKRGSRKPKAPAYTAKKNPKYLYTNKGDDSSKEEEQSKGKGRMQAKIALILMIVVITETMIPLETTKQK